MTSATPEHAGSRRWHARPTQAVLARALAYALPLAGSIVFVHFASKAVPRPTGSLWLFVAWWIGMSAAATVVLFGVDRFSRRLLPLAALLKLSLVFPDQAPSRLNAALRSGSVQSLERRIALVQQARDAATPAEAAEHLLQLVAALSAHDRVTRGHSERVRGYSVLIGEELSLSHAEIDLLNWAALLHDVGKLDVPDEILNKPSKPSEEEWEVLRRHPLFGEELVQPLREWLGTWADGVGYHHERWDGMGYPRGIAADDIPLPGRIIAVADVFDVITSARSYKQPSGAVEGRKEIARCAGTQFDPLVVRAFLNASLGRMRLIMGPLSWLAHAPVLARVPLSPGLGALVGALTVVAVSGGVTTTSQTARAHGRTPDAVLHRPAARAQDQPVSPAVRRETVNGRPSDEAAPLPEDPRSTEDSPTATDVPPRTPTAPTTVPTDDPPPPSPPQPPKQPQQPRPGPTAVDDAASVLEGGSVLVEVLANDVDPASGGIHVSAIGSPRVGSAVLEGGAIRYQAPSAFVGSTRFPYTIKGATGATSTAIVSIDVAPVNDAPSFTAGGAQTVLEDSGAQTVPGWASGISAGPANESEQSVTFTVNTSNSSLFSSQPAVESDGTLTFTPAPNANGTATITVGAHDDGGTADGGVDTSAPATRQITILPVNDAPGFIAGPDQAVTENSGAHQVAWASGIAPGPADESPQAVSFAVGNDNNGLFSVQPTIDPGGTLAFTVAPSIVGAARLTVRASDNGGTAHGGDDISALVTFTITVTDVNDAPSFAAGAAQTVLEDSGAQTVPGWASGISAGPANESAQQIVFTVTSNNSALFSAQPSVAADGTLTYTPAANANGTATVTVTAHDDGGTADGGFDTSPPATLQITVLAVNDAPGFTAGPDQSIAKNAGPQTISGWATGISSGPADEVGQTVTFSVSNSDSSIFVAEPAVASDGTLTFEARNGNPGTGVVTVTVTAFDDGGTANGGQNGSAALTFTITIA